MAELQLIIVIGPFPHECSHLLDCLKVPHNRRKAKVLGYPFGFSEILRTAHLGHVSQAGSVRCRPRAQNSG